jgi:hypothetical protein
MEGFNIMKKKIFYAVFGFAFLFIIIFINKPKSINASEIVTMVQSNYSSIKFNDKIIIVGGEQQYLIDDFIPKLSRLTVMPYEGDIDGNYSYRTEISQKNGTQISIFDNAFMVVNDNIYKITNGEIDYNKLYSLFLD